MPSLKKMKDKINNWIELDESVIVYCEKCCAISPSNKAILQCKTSSCSGLRYQGHDQKKQIVKTYFMKASIEAQLKTVLERPGMRQKFENSIRRRMSSDQSVICDIIDGTISKCHLILSSNAESLSLTWNTDGVALYIQLWPIYLVVNEIPPSERFEYKNVCLWGIWQGRGKPPTNAFMKSFVDDINKLATEGFELQLQVDGVKIKKNVVACTIVSSMDLIAKAPILNMVQHNGKYGCCTCLIEGVHVKNGKGHAHMYPFSEVEAAIPRTSKSFYSDAVKAVDSFLIVTGIKGVSMLHGIRNLDIVQSVVPEHMHGVLLGIVKSLLFLWFESTEHKNQVLGKKSYPDYYIGHLIDEVDLRLVNMKPPSNINRRPRSLKGNLHNLKANELRAWLLYYSLPCLKDIIPESYWKHFCLHCEGIHILSEASITQEDLINAETLLTIFYKHFALLYSIVIITTLLIVVGTERNAV